MHLTLTERIRLAYSQVELWFGLILLLAGAGTFTQTEWESLSFWFGAVATVPGHIATIYPTTTQVDERAVWGYTYRYPAMGLEWAGTSFSTDSTLQPGQRADVEYTIAHPAVSRLKGTDTTPAGTTGLLASLLFLGIGLGISWAGARQARQLLAIADDARIGKATYTRTSTQPGQDGADTAYLLHYTYYAGGASYTLHLDSAQARPSREQVLVVFQGTNPANARLLTSLPALLQAKLTNSPA